MKTFNFGSAKTSHAGLDSRLFPAMQYNRLVRLPNGERGRLVTLNRYGQDAVSVVERWEGKLGQHESVVTTCDGHGGLGDIWAVFVASRLPQKIARHWWDIKRLMRASGTPIEDRDQAVVSYIQDLFRAVERELTPVVNETATQIHGPHVDLTRGGTTATTTLVMIVGRRRYIIQAAVGDSPSFLRRGDPLAATVTWGPVEQLVTEANGDNARSVEEYVRRHLDARVPREQIPPIYVSRVNCGPHCPVVNGAVDHYGFRRPLRAWNFFNAAGDVDVTPDMESYEIMVSAGHPYGTQGLSGRPELKVRESDNVWVVADPALSLTNYGNSVAGDGQNTTGFGDFHAGLASDCHASVAIREVPEQCVLGAYTDGASDLLDSDTLTEGFMSVDSRDLTMEWLSHTADAHIDSSQRSVFVWNHDNRPAWDDVSVCGIKLPAWNPPSRRRRCH